MSSKIIKECREKDLEHLSDYKKAIKIANLDDNGVGSLSRNDLPDNLRPTNGKTWERRAEDYFIIESIKEGREKIIWNFLGFKEKNNSYPVPTKVKNKLKGKPCVFLATHSCVEADHKYPYHFYDVKEFNENENNFQPINRAVNAKKREEKRKREKTGFKSDNRRIGCAFSTAKNTLKYNKDLLSIANPYDGDHWTDPMETSKRDHILYTDYYIALKSKYPDLDHNKFWLIFIPKINELIREQHNVEDIESIVNLL